MSERTLARLADAGVIGPVVFGLGCIVLDYGLWSHMGEPIQPSPPAAPAGIG